MRATHQRGFTLLEIMIAMTIGLFLAGALVTVVQTNKTVFLNQNQLEQMQDGQRMAMTLMADVIQSAGTTVTSIDGISLTGDGNDNLNIGEIHVSTN